jgi:MinD-like ATPase involved in chromosome partitioning or flagellar assembly
MLVLEGIGGLRAHCDLLMIDAGVSPNLFFFAGVADRLVLVMTPRRDTCGKPATLITALAAQLPKIAVDVLINKTEEGADGLSAFATLAGLCKPTIAADLHYLGECPFDRRLDTTHPGPSFTAALAGAATDEVATQLVARLLTPHPVPLYGQGKLLQ